MRSWGWGPHDGITVLRRRGRDQSAHSPTPLCLPLCLVKTQWEGSCLSANRKEGSPQTLNLPAPQSWASHPPEPGEINVCCLSHPDYGILLWQPQLTNIGGCDVFSGELAVKHSSEHHCLQDSSYSHPLSLFLEIYLLRKLGLIEFSLFRILL